MRAIRLTRKDMVMLRILLAALIVLSFQQWLCFSHPPLVSLDPGLHYITSFFAITALYANSHGPI